MKIGLVIIIIFALIAGVNYYAASRIALIMRKICPVLPNWVYGIMFVCMVAVLVLGFARSMLPISAGIKKTDVKYIEAEETSSHQRKLVVEALVCAPKNCSSESLIFLLDKIFQKSFESHGKTITLYGFSTDSIRYSSSICALILPIYITVGL